MFKYCSLYSSSSGNSFFIQSDTTNLLIDAGVSAKKIDSALKQINIDIHNINAILVTHEHIDHTKSIATLSKTYNLPVYANEKTWKAIPDIAKKITKENQKIFNIMKPFFIGDIKILPFQTSHDAASPCGFTLSYLNKQISIATDLGCVSSEVLNNLKKSSCVLLEANYDPNILKCSSYPYALKKRIASDKGHLSNIMAGKVLSNLYNFGLEKALLIHLSKENNFPELVYETIKEETSNCKNLSIDVAPRNKPTKLFEVS